MILFQKIFIPNVKGSFLTNLLPFENKWLRYPKIATNSKKKEMERLELLPWFMNIQKDKWTLGFQKCIFYRHFRGWTGKIVWKFSINFKSILFLLFLHESNPSEGPFLNSVNLWFNTVGRRDDDMIVPPSDGPMFILIDWE